MPPEASRKPKLAFILVQATTTRGLSPRLAAGIASATYWKMALEAAGFVAGDEVVVTLAKRRRRSDA